MSGLPTSPIVDYSVAAFVFVGSMYVLLKLIELIKALMNRRELPDPTVRLAEAVNELTSFLREDKAAQREINRAYDKAFQDILRCQNRSDEKLDKILDSIAAHVLLCQKCINR